MPSQMCRIPALAATAMLALSNGAFAAPATPATEVEAAKPASAADRVAASRLPSALDRFTFWSREVRINPRDIEANLELAKVLRSMDRFDEAMGAADSVLVLQPDNKPALLEKARIFVAAGQGFYAIEPARKAAAQDANDWRPVALLAVAYEQAQRDDEAMAAYRRAVAMAPAEAAPASNLGLYLAGLGQRQEAEAILRRAAALPTATLRERQNLALVLGLEGRISEAERLMRQDLAPDAVDANLAILRASAPGAPSAAPSPSVRTYEALRAGG